MATPLMLSGVTTYDNVRFIDAIVDECEIGIFANSARLIDNVLRDARVYSTLMTRISGLLGKPLEFEPAKDTTVGRKYASELETDWSTMFEHSALVELMSWGLMQGVGVAQVVEETDPWSLEVWHPWALNWDEYERQYWIATREDGRLYLLPDPQGGFVDENRTRWVLFTPFGFGNSGRRCYLRCLHRLGSERQWSHRDRARYSEVFGQTIRFGIAPANATKDERAKFKKALLLGSEPVIVGNQGAEGNKWDIKLVEASGKSTELFDRTLTQLDKEIATLLLGQSQTTDGQAGLGSNDQAGEPVRLDIMSWDEQALTSTLRTQFLVRYWQFAYGNGDMAPWPCYRIVPPEDRGKKAQEFKLVVDGIVAAKAAGIPIDEREILEDYGVPMISEEEQARIDAEKQQKAIQIAQPDQNQNGMNGTQADKAETQLPVPPPAQ